MCFGLIIGHVSSLSFIFLQLSEVVVDGLPLMRATEVPANYACYNDIQLVGNINVQNIFDLNSPQQTTMTDFINSKSTSSVNIL